MFDFQLYGELARVLGEQGFNKATPAVLVQAGGKYYHLKRIVVKKPKGFDMKHLVIVAKGKGYEQSRQT